MDFDEYEYLEKTVENPVPPNQSENGNTGKSGEKERSSKSSRLRTDENNSGSNDRAKRSRSEDEHRDRDRDRRRERGSSHHLSSSEHRSRDGERSDRDRHRSSRDRRDREEKSGREKDGDREHDRHQDRESEKDKERDRDRERERDRSRRSRSRSERHRNDRDRDSERDRDRGKSKERELKERERERERERELKERERELRERERELRERERERESRRYKDKKEEVAEPEADPERDQRTVFAYQICLKADERDVYEFFSRAGKVRDVRLIMDRNSRRSKGVGYIEFYDAMSVPMAIALSGQPLLGQPVMVKPSEAEKNLVQSNATAAGSGSIGPYSGGARRLYVGNLHFNITEDQLRQVFEPFGAVELVQLPLDLETGHCKGFGFVQFTRLEDARAAQNLNGQLEIAGRLIKVSAVSDQVGMQDIGTNAGDFDDDEGGGLALNARSRALLMQKLDRTGTATSITGSLTTPLINGTSVPLTSAPTLGITPLVSTLGQPSIPAIPGLSGSVLPVGTALVPQIDSIGSPTECLLLKNMFDPMLETEDDFDMDIKEDVLDECSKFGSVKHIFVDKNSAGHVYLRFEAANSAVNAQRALHGRWFAGKMITATYMSPQNYDAKFPNI